MNIFGWTLKIENKLPQMIIIYQYEKKNARNWVGVNQSGPIKIYSHQFKKRGK